MSNAGYPTLPRQRSTTRVQLPDGTTVEVIVRWEEIAMLARRAQHNKGKQATDGPVTVKVLA